MDMRYFSNLIESKDHNYEQVKEFMISMVKNSVKGSEFETKTKEMWEQGDDALINSLLKMGYDAAVFSLDNMFLGHIAYQHDSAEKDKVNLFSFYVVSCERGHGWPYKFTEELIKNIREKGVQKINIGKQENRLIKRLVSGLKDKQQELRLRLEGNLAHLV